MRRKIDQYFKKGLNVPQGPPADAWEFIRQHIAQNEKEKKRIFPFWAKISGGAALLLLMIGGGYLINRGFSPQENNNQNVAMPSSENPSANSALNPSELFVPTTENPAAAQSSHVRANRISFHSVITSAQVHNPFTANQSEENYTENPSDFLMNPPSQNNLQKPENEANLNWPEIAWEIPSWNPSIAENGNMEEVKEETPPESLLAVNDNLKQKEKSTKFKKKKEDFDRFYIAGFASPMAFNTFVGNSMLADKMSQYKTENNITLSYGVKAGYAISPVVKVRTGVSVIGFEQITKDVPLATSIEGRNDLPAVDQVNNINYNGSLRIDNSLSASLSDDELNNKIGNGNIQQQSSYIEIPLEAEVRLFHTNSIGISATGGGSTWLLSKNKLYVHTDGYTEELGKANNLNNVSFSANAGLKFDMNLSEKVKLNIEPNLKYLINPVNDIKKYNPYTVGVNAGISVSLK